MVQQHTSVFLIAALAPASNNSLSADRFSLATAWCTAEDNIRNDSKIIGQCCVMLLTCVAVVVLLIDGCIQCEQGAEGVGTEGRARISQNKKLKYENNDSSTKSYVIDLIAAHMRGVRPRGSGQSTSCGAIMHY